MYINSLLIELKIGTPFSSGNGYGISDSFFFLNFFNFSLLYRLKIILKIKTN